jgi:hypothetical protein
MRPISGTACVLTRPGKKQKAFFFEKKNQKTFALALGWTGFFSALLCAVPNRQKFFGSFFQRRTRLPGLSERCAVQ